MNINLNANTSASQNARIAEYLKNGHSINPDTALRLFGCNRLAARILNIKNALHMNIITTRVDAGPRKIAEYRLDMENPVLVYKPRPRNAGTEIKALDNMSRLVLEALQKGEHLTALSAFVRVNNCRRLATRVFYLKRHGYKIESKTILLNNGKRITEYWLAA